MYTYDEIRTELLRQISHLLAIEPKWKKCDNCPYSGHCCINADINIYDYEWLIIRNYLLSTPDVLNLVKKNYYSKSLCYFRTNDRCLIHEIRPLNCIFTPYQAIYAADKRIHYSPYVSDCSLSFATSITFSTIDLSKQLILLPDEFSSTFYLLLNRWYQDYEENSVVCNTEKPLSDIMESFLIQH